MAATPFTLAPSAARTTSGTNIVSGLGEYDKVRIQLNVTAASGTTPTLDVTIQDTVDGTNYNTLATFTQKVAVVRDVLTLTNLVGDSVRVSWVVAGTTPSFTFDVSALAERVNG